MKNRLSAVLLILFPVFVWSLAALAQAAPPQEPAASAEQTPGQIAPGQITPGVVMAAELSKSIDAKKAKAGEPVEAKVSVDLLAHGQIVIPRNTKIVGHITTVKAHAKDSPDSSVGIAFDRIIMKDGKEMPLKAAIQAIAPPLAYNNYNNAPGGPTAGDTSPQGPPASGNVGSGQMPRTATNTAGSYGMNGPSSGSDTGPNSNHVPVLTAQSQGAVGMNKISLSSEADATVIHSDSQNVHLETGTQLMLKSE
jgi:hypothetical protein